VPKRVREGSNERQRARKRERAQERAHARKTVWVCQECMGSVWGVCVESECVPACVRVYFRVCA